MRESSPNWFDRLIISLLETKRDPGSWASNDMLVCIKIFSCYTAGCDGARNLRLLLFGAIEDELGKPLVSTSSLEQFKELELCRSAAWFRTHSIYGRWAQSYVRRASLQFALVNGLDWWSSEARTAANEKWDQMYAQGTIIAAPHLLGHVRKSLREQVAILFFEGLENSIYLNRGTVFDNSWPFNVGSRLIDHIYETLKELHDREYVHELMRPYPNLYQKMCLMEQVASLRATNP